MVEINDITITHPQKRLFPNSNITKGQIVEYYQKIADYILPYLKDRPLTINCFPEGIDKPGFYRQHAPADIPSWFKTVKLKKKTDNSMMTHILCQNTASLIYLANLNMITPHRWLSKHQHPEHPDIMLIDIDPPAHRFDLAIKGAKLLREELKDYSSFPMLTGSKGLHVIIPVKGKTFAQVKGLLEELTSKIVKKHPDEFTNSLRKEHRTEAVYFDILRNAYGQTAVAPFAVRAKEGAPVATPLAWEELDDTTITSQRYNIHNIFTRLSSLKNHSPLQ